MASKSKSKSKPKISSSQSKAIQNSINKIQAGINSVAASKGVTLTKNPDGSYSSGKVERNPMQYGAAGRGEVLGAYTESDFAGPAVESVKRKAGESSSAYKARIRGTSFNLAGGGGPSTAGGATAPVANTKGVGTVGPKLGDRGAAVSALQQALNKKYGGKEGYVALKVDGIYGPKTQAANDYQEPGAPGLESDLQNATAEDGSTDTTGVDTQRYARTVNPYDRQIKDVTNTLNDYVGDEPSLAKITKEKRKNAQSLIDSVTAEFNRALVEQQGINQGMDARTRANNISAGLGGSDFATAAAVKTEKEGKQKTDMINAERSAKVAAILADVDQRATEEYRTQRTEYIRGLEGNLTRLKEAKKEDRERALDTVKGLASNNIPIDKLKSADPKTYATLLSEYGGSKLDLETAWNAALPDEFKVKYDQEVIKGKNGNAVILRYGINPQTGTMDKKEYDLGVNYDVYAGEKPIEADGILYTRNADGTLKPLTGVSEKVRSEINKNNAAAAKDRADSANPEKKNSFKFTGSQKSKLLAANFIEEDINYLQEDLKTYGLQAVLDNLETDQQRSAVKDALKGSSLADQLAEYAANN